MAPLLHSIPEYSNLMVQASLHDALFNVTALYCNYHQLRAISPLLAKSKLSVIHIDIHGLNADYDALPGMLEVLAAPSASVCRVTLGILNQEIEVDQLGFKLALSSLQNVQTIDLGPLDLEPECLLAIAHLPSLEHLRLKSPIISETHRLPQYQPMFVSLVALDIFCGASDAINELFEIYLAATHLVSLSIRVKESPESDQLCRLATTIQMLPMALSIKKFSLSRELGFVLRREEGHILESRMLEALLPCSHLETVEIEYPLSYAEIDNRLIDRMANAWSNLQVLRLPCHDRGAMFGPTQITLDGILPFAEHARLRELSLPLQGSIMDTSRRHDQAKYAGYFSGIKRFSLSLGPIHEDPQAVASFIINTFPPESLVVRNPPNTPETLVHFKPYTSLTVLNCSHHDFLLYKQRWAEVQNVVGTFI